MHVLKRCGPAWRLHSRASGDSAHRPQRLPSHSATVPLTFPMTKDPIFPKCNRFREIFSKGIPFLPCFCNSETTECLLNDVLRRTECVPPKSICWHCTPQCSDVWRWGPSVGDAREQRAEPSCLGWTPWWGRPLHPVGAQAEVRALPPWRPLSPEPDFRPMSNTSVFLPTRVCALLREPLQTRARKDHVETPALAPRTTLPRVLPSQAQPCLIKPTIRDVHWWHLVGAVKDVRKNRWLLLYKTDQPSTGGKITLKRWFWSQIPFYAQRKAAPRLSHQNGRSCPLIPS